MKTLFKLMIILIVFSGLTGCDWKNKTNSDQVMQQETEMMLSEANRQIGQPAITNFTERKNAKMILELRDEANLVCYAYIVNHMTGQLSFLGKCMGFGLPYSVQFTNPNKLVDRFGGAVDNGQEAYQIPQADPNGLFMPEGLSATWLMMINPEDGSIHPVYAEPEIIVSPFPLHKS